MRILVFLLPLLGAVPLQAAHPDFRLLDNAGRPVTSTARPHDFVQSCGSCHDVEYISTHSSHTPGLGGGPGEAASSDWLYTEGDPVPDCFACHLDQADLPQRIRRLSEGDAEHAGMATLAASELVDPEALAWNTDAFGPDGAWPVDRLPLQAGSRSSCGTCHGLAEAGGGDALLQDAVPADWAWQGQFYSAQRLSDSPLNLADKTGRHDPWDVHARALLECTACHHGIDNPMQRRLDADLSPPHLLYEPRRQGFGDWLEQPSHRLASVGDAGEAQDMRSCRDCHDPFLPHEWLPYRESHFERLDCRACHIPEMPAGALAELRLAQGKVVESSWRGAGGPPSDSRLLQRGAKPLLLEKTDHMGKARYVPVNLVLLVEDARRELRIVELQHGIQDGSRALRDCGSCHHPEAASFRMPVALSADGEAPPFRDPQDVYTEPTLLPVAGQGLVAQSARGNHGYMPGQKSAMLDVTGLVLLMATLVAVCSHGFLRWRAGSRREGES